ncbi:MAG: helix-hairpin-helix domain-containing protein [Bacteroidetes bacterium]|nr:helix-hairpin-helix domain-containing protein [Bacteroidota bacterium]
MHNYEIAEYFSLLSKLMEIHGEDPFKIKSYSNAAFTLDKLNDPVVDMEPHQLFSIRGIGDAIGKKVIEIIDNKRLSLLDSYVEKTPTGVLEFLKIKGLGPKKITTIWKELEIESIGELLYACEENRLTKYKGFGEKTQQNIQESLQFYLQHQGRFLFQQVEPLVENLKIALNEKINGDDLFIISGGFKRQLEIIDYIDIVTTYSENDLTNWLREKNFQCIKNENFLSCKGSDQFEMRWYFTNFDDYYWTDFTLSCSPEFLEKWVSDPLFSKKIPFISEKSIFEQINIPLIPSPLREHPSIIEQAKNNKLPKLIQTSDIKGIIHSHSTWSDGVHTIEHMALAAIEKGYEYLIISDHSKSAFYAGGLSIDSVKAQHKEIEALNKKLAPFVIFKSIESDILNDGSLDYPEDILACFDIVIASIHSNLKMTEEKAMMRLLNAVNHPYTSILGHPTGRLLLSRKGYPVDHEALIQACADNNVVMELNAHPRRLDMDWRFIQSAIKNDVLISIDPDAHSIEGFEDVRYGVLVAQKAGLTAAQNLSSFSLAEMIEFVEFQQSKRN